MMKQANKLAETIGAGLCRRGFLGWVGKGALGLAGVIGGLTALPEEAKATHNLCCFYTCVTGATFNVCRTLILNCPLTLFRGRCTRQSAYACDCDT